MKAGFGLASLILFDKTMKNKSPYPQNENIGLAGLKNHLGHLPSYGDGLRIMPNRPDKPHETLNHSIHGPYLEKWLIDRGDQGIALYLHHFIRSDADGEWHDHPWDNETLVIEGGYWECTPAGRRWLGPGDRVSRKATDFHRVELEPGIRPYSLFYHGTKINEWGAMGTDGIKIHHHQFVQKNGAYRI